MRTLILNLNNFKRHQWYCFLLFIFLFVFVFRHCKIMNTHALFQTFLRLSSLLVAARTLFLRHDGRPPLNLSHRIPQKPFRQLEGETSKKDNDGYPVEVHIDVNDDYWHSGKIYSYTNHRIIYLGWEGTAGISAQVASQDQQPVWYDLNGRRVEHPTKGVYVFKGKKCVIKQSCWRGFSIPDSRVAGSGLAFQARWTVNLSDSGDVPSGL